MAIASLAVMRYRNPQLFSAWMRKILHRLRREGYTEVPDKGEMQSLVERRWEPSIGSVFAYVSYWSTHEWRIWINAQRWYNNNNKNNKSQNECTHTHCVWGHMRVDENCSLISCDAFCCWQTLQSAQPPLVCVALSSHSVFPHVSDVCFCWSVFARNRQSLLHWASERHEYTGRYVRDMVFRVYCQR